MSKEFIQDKLSECYELDSTIDMTKKNNHFIDDYSYLNHYDQRHTHGWLPKVFDVFGDIHDLRYGILKAGKELPPHIDAPDGHRFIAMLKGCHTYLTDTNEVTMSQGEIWFINSSYKHSVINNTDDDRIALLGKFNNVPELLRTKS